MEITRVSMISKKENTLDLDVTPRQIKAWRCGMLIQENLLCRVLLKMNGIMYLEMNKIHNGE